MMYHTKINWLCLNVPQQTSLINLHQEQVVREKGIQEFLIEHAKRCFFLTLLCYGRLNCDLIRRLLTLLFTMNIFLVPE